MWLLYDLSLFIPAERMRRQRQFSQRMVVAHQSYRFGLADLRHGLDAVARLADAETVAGKDLSVALGVQFGETLRELKLLAIDVQCSVGTFLALNGISGQTGGIDTEEVAHACFLEFEVTGHAVERHDVHDVLLHGSEDPLQHVVEVHADVRGYTSGLVYIAFPRGVVPLATAGDVRQVHVVDLVFRSVINFLLECTNLVVQAQD